MAKSIVEGLFGDSSQDSTNISNISQNTTGLLEGITESKNIATKQLSSMKSIEKDVGSQGWFHDAISKLVGGIDEKSESDKEANNLSESIRESLEGIKALDEIDSVDKKDSKKKRGKVTASAKRDDLKSLPFEFATLGAVLVNTIEGKGDKDKKGKGISGFFKGLMEGIGGIASLGLALIAFAGATLLFNFVDWGRAIIGMLAFTVFTIGMVQLAKVIAKGDTLKNFAQMAFGSLLMSAALGAFAIGVFLVSAVVGHKPFSIGSMKVPAFDIGDALLGIGLFLVFEVALAKVAGMLNKDTGNFANFAVGSIIMSAALVAFVFAMVIVSHIFTDGVNLGKFGEALGWGTGQMRIDMAAATQGVKAFLAFEIGLAVVARIAGGQTPNFIKFAIGSVIMSGALVAFSLSLVIVSKLFTEGVSIGKYSLPPVDMKMALIGVGTFLVFLGIVTALALTGGGAAGPLALFAGASVLMSVALVAFSVAMVAASVAAFGGNVEVGGKSFKVPKNNAIKALAAIPTMVAFMLSFTALGAMFLVPFAGQALLAGLMAASVAALAMSAAVIAFSGALTFASLAINGGTAELGGKKYTLVPYDKEATSVFFDAMHSYIDQFADIASKIGLKGTIAVAILGKTLMPVIDAMAKMTDVVIKAGQNRKEIEAIVSGDSNVLDHLMDPVLWTILGRKEDGSGGLAGVSERLGFWGSKMLKRVSESLMPIVNTMEKMLNIVTKAATSKSDIEKLMNSKGGMQMIEHLLDPVIFLILGTNMDGSGGLLHVSMQMGRYGAKTLKLVGESMGPLIDSMDKMIDIVHKAATLKADGMTTRELVKLAMDNLNLIMVGDGTIKGFIAMFVETADQLQWSSKRAIEAISAMPPMVQSLGDLVVVVAKAGELDPEKIKRGVFGLEQASGFLKTFITTINDIIPGGVGGAISKLWGGDPISKLQDAHEYLKPGGAFYNIFQDLANIAKSFDGDGFANLGKVAIVGTFTTEVLRGSEYFEEIMKHIQKGIDKFKPGQDISAIGKAMDQIAKAGDISGKFDPLNVLIEKSAQLHTAATDLERIAKAYKNMSVAENMGDIGGKAAGWAGKIVKEKKEETSASTSSVISSGALTVEEILNDWYANGVYVKPGPKEAAASPQAANLMSLD